MPLSSWFEYKILLPVVDGDFGIIVWILFYFNSVIVHFIYYMRIRKGIRTMNYHPYMQVFYFFKIAFFSMFMVLTAILITYSGLLENDNILEVISHFIHGEDWDFPFQILASIVYPVFVICLYFFKPLHKWILSNFNIYLTIIFPLFFFLFFISIVFEIHPVNQIVFWFIQFFNSELEPGLAYYGGRLLKENYLLGLYLALSPFQLFVFNYIFGFNTMMIVKKIISNESPELINEYYGKT